MMKHFKVRFIVLGLSLLAVGLTACGATVESPQPVFLKAVGSTSMVPLVSELAAAYHQGQSLVTIDVDGGGSQLGLAQAQAKQVEMGLVSHLPDELPEGLRAVVVARDGVAIIVHPDNPLANITLAELQALFAGRISTWGELPRAGAGEIQLVSREDGSGTRAVFEARAMGGLRVSPTAVVMPGSQAVIEFVAGHPEAVGYVSAGLVPDSVRVLAVEDSAPVPDLISTGAYPLTREFNILVQVDTPPEVEAFLNFVLSPAGQAIVAGRYGRVR
ncbi:MAG: phosphate ABC transporter substrate-binding protein [Anaerolineae bacterium]